jgi:hypothetical protein
MYQIIFAVALVVGILLSFFFVDEKFFNANKTGYKMQFVMVSFLLFIAPLLAIPTPVLSIKLIKLISIPGLLTFLSIQVPKFRQVISQAVGIDIDENEMSVQDFLKTRFGFVASMSLYIIYFCINQMVILPWLSTSPSTTMPDIANGQFLPVFKKDVLKVIYNITLFTIVPLFISDKFTDLIAKLANNSNKKDILDYKAAMRVVASFMGFLLAYTLTGSITPVEIGGALAAALALFFTGTLSTIFDVMQIRLPPSAISQVFTHDEVFLLFSSMYVCLLILATYLNPLIPGISHIRQQFAGSAIGKISDLGKLIVLFWMVPSLTGSTYSASIAKTTKNKQAIDKLNGYALGYIMGFLLSLSGYLYIDPKIMGVANTISKVR